MNLGLERLPWYGQVAAFVGLAAAGAGAYYTLYDRPFTADLEARRAELRSVRGDIDKAAAAARRLDEFRASVADLESQLTSVKEILPEEKDAADLLRRMQTVAALSRLTLRSFKPQPTLAKPTHAEWPIALEIEGTYHDLATFLDRVGKFPRIVNITGLDIKGREKPGPGGTVGATCVATTFVLVDKAAAPAKPASSQKAAN